MQLALCLPPGWRADLGSLTLLAVMPRIVGAHQLVVTAPDDEGLTRKELDSLGAAAQPQSLHYAATAADLCFLPVSAASASWADVALRQAGPPTVLFVNDLATAPRLWPDLAKQADGLLVCEPHWAELLQHAAPQLPTLLLSPAASATRICAECVEQPACPYLVSWSPATVASKLAIAQAFANPAAAQRDLQLVVLGDGDTAEWQRVLRLFGVLGRSWLLGVASYARAEELLAGALAAIAPVAPAGRSTALLAHMARRCAPHYVTLTPGEADWVIMSEGSTPTVSEQAPDAAAALIHSLDALLALDADAAADLLCRRREKSERRGGELASKVEPFLRRVQAHAARRAHAPSASDLPSHITNLTMATMRELGLTRLAPQMVSSLAQSLAGLLQ